MPEAERKFPGRMVYPIVAALVVLQGGCLALGIVGACAGGAAATGYLYSKGRVYRDYPASVPDLRNAIHAALQDLHFLIFTEEAKDGKAFVVTKTTNGKTVRVYIDSISSPIPAEGLMTRVSVRVATFGDESVSVRILDQVGWRLAHAPTFVPGPPPVPPAPIQQTSGVKPTATRDEPPLAPPPPAKTK
jgi:hypothetical protein